MKYWPHVLLEMGSPSVCGTTADGNCLAAPNFAHTPRIANKSQLLKVKPAATLLFTTTHHLEVTRIALRLHAALEM